MHRKTHFWRSLSLNLNLSVLQRRTYTVHWPQSEVWLGWLPLLGPELAVSILKAFYLFNRKCECVEKLKLQILNWWSPRSLGAFHTHNFWCKNFQNCFVTQIHNNITKQHDHWNFYWLLWSSEFRNLFTPSQWYEQASCNSFLCLVLYPPVIGSGVSADAMLGLGRDCFEMVIKPSLLSVTEFA